MVGTLDILVLSHLLMNFEICIGYGWTMADSAELAHTHQAHPPGSGTADPVTSSSPPILGLLLLLLSGGESMYGGTSTF